MQFFSQLTTQSSGSLGGVTASHNQHVRYLRARTTPVDPATAAQRTIRRRFSTLSVWWQSQLTQAQRDDWNTYGRNVMMSNALGDPMHWTGRHHFFRANMVREFARPPALAILNAPTVFNVSSNTPPTFTATALTDRIEIHFDHADGWRHEAQGFMMVYFALRQTTSINFFKGPYYFQAFLQGDPVFPPISPITLSAVGLVQPNTRWFFRTVTTRVDGRVAGEKRAWCNLA